MSTPSTTRTLSDIATPGGVFAIIAMDQRNTLRRMFTAVGIDASDDDMVTAKTDVARALTPLASGILFDPTYGVPAVTGTGALADSCGLLVASEPAERGKQGVEPVTRRDPALDSRWVLSQGGDANKFFAQLRADRPAPRPVSPTLPHNACRRCARSSPTAQAVGIPSVIENLVYPFEGEDLSGRRREDAIIEAARALNEIDCDLLKLEYPGSPDGCRRLAEVLDRPWAVLSAGVPFDDFTQGAADRLRRGRRLRLHRRSVRVAGSAAAQRQRPPTVPRRRRPAAPGTARRRGHRSRPSLHGVGKVTFEVS